MALRQGWRHSGGGDDESIRTTFIATSLLVKDRRSPSIPQDPEQGAVSQSGAAARNSFSRIPGSWFGIANPTGYEVGEESLAATNWSSLATRNEEQFRCLTTKPYEGNRVKDHHSVMRLARKSSSHAAALRFKRMEPFAVAFRMRLLAMCFIVVKLAGA
jgi:hypothetical protein